MIKDFRDIEKVSCAGIPITTFLSDDRKVIWVSVTDLATNLNLDIPECVPAETFTLYDPLGRGEDHSCILFTELNQVLWSAQAGPDDLENLADFRRYFMYEVISFWTRFAPAAASLSLREATRIIDQGLTRFSSHLDVPASIPIETAFRILGYDKIQEKSQLSLEEYMFVVNVEGLFASMCSDMFSRGHTVEDTLQEVLERLEEAARPLANLVRDTSGGIARNECSPEYLQP